jgi:putative transposase
MSNHLYTELMLRALDMALLQRRPEGVIHHSDQGAQYTSIAFGRRCREAGVQPSMGTAGDAYDKACVSHYTSSRRSETTSGWRRRQDSLTPIAFLGESAPGGSYRHSFLSL